MGMPTRRLAARTLRTKLVPNDPWTMFDDMTQVRAASNQPIPPNIHKLGNLTFLPPTVNNRSKTWNGLAKRSVWLLASPQNRAHQLCGFRMAGSLPPAVHAYLSDAWTPTL